QARTAHLSGDREADGEPRADPGPLPVTGEPRARQGRRRAGVRRREEAGDRLEALPLEEPQLPLRWARSPGNAGARGGGRAAGPPRRSSPVTMSERRRLA